MSAVRPNPDRDSTGAGATSNVQVPGSAPSQLSRSPVQAVSQHTSSTQNPEAHTDAVLHSAPFGFGVLVGVALGVAVSVRVGVRVGVAVCVAVGVQPGCDTPPHVLQMLPSHSAGAVHRFPGQQNPPAPPQGTQVSVVGEHTLPVTHGMPGGPTQQGSPVVPQSWQVPITHVRPRLHNGPSVQQGWLVPPQGVHVPPAHTKPKSQLSGGTVLQHGSDIWPQGVQRPPMHTDVIPQKLPVQHG